MTWNDITLNQFNAISKALKIEDETEKFIALCEAVYGEDVTSLPLQDFNKKVRLDFLQKEIPTNHIITKFKIDDREYTVDCLTGNMTTAQYIDFINHSKSQDYAKILSVFFIPKEHKYNDGYNMDQVIKDMGEVPIDIVVSEAFFFGRQLQKFMQIFLHSFKKNHLKEIPEKERMIVEKLLKVQDMALSHMF